jgi:hypothetical protein
VKLMGGGPGGRLVADTSTRVHTGILMTQLLSLSILPGFQAEFHCCSWNSLGVWGFVLVLIDCSVSANYSTFRGVVTVTATRLIVLTASHSLTVTVTVTAVTV